ncbi:GTP pyrophosphokinase family protein [Faecalicoccus pleomorphus]|uniref:GTP pyrophosphokinase n=1 Tax=Faecalicoccus pleomorphus TaxID=1323 RepID=UPI00142FCD3A|nr:GTP pyrophosphokinase family protein [Faecalicoccus pleomorphus]NJE40816.1 GTP pyrophosphokinase family protein [Faecalicoccus pleomorphus]
MENNACLIENAKVMLFKQIQEDSIPLRTLMAYYRCAIMEVETKFRVLNEEFSIEREHNPIETIKSRLKSPESIINKLQSRNLPLTVQSIETNLFDIAGIRVICSFQNDIYLLAEYLLSQDDIELVEIKDYIKTPKENGYRSLHLIVKVPIFLHEEKRSMNVEVQFRTIAMDSWASLEHKIRYKKELDEQTLKTINDDLLECALQSARLDEKMEKVHQQSMKKS